MPNRSSRTLRPTSGANRLERVVRGVAGDAGVVQQPLSARADRQDGIEHPFGPLLSSVLARASSSGGVASTVRTAVSCANRIVNQRGKSEPTRSRLIETATGTVNDQQRLTPARLRQLHRSAAGVEHSTTSGDPRLLGADIAPK